MSRISTRILDACCGGKMFWWDKQNPDVTFLDQRQGTFDLGTYPTKQGLVPRTITVSPDVIGDFRNLPFEDESFHMVVFDPPHLLHAGDNSRLAIKYGRLNRETWQHDLGCGFSECMRVLKPNGTLIFKWNTEQIKLSDVLDTTEFKPLFGDKRAKTRWLVFMKGPDHLAKELTPVDRIAKVADLLPPEAIEDIQTRLGGWILAGGQTDDAYAVQQARFAENIAAEVLARQAKS